MVASDDHVVVDRRRLELLAPGLPAAPIHHEGGAHELHRTGPELDDAALAALVAEVRASAVQATSEALDAIVADLPGPIGRVALRDWPDGLPTDIATLRRAPHESKADSVMYRRILAELAAARGWAVHRYGKDVEREARALLGAQADEVLVGPRTVLGPPWTKDHRVALAALVTSSG